MTNPSHVVPDSRTASLSTWWIPLRSDRQVAFFSNYVRNDHYDQWSSPAVQTVFSMMIIINYWSSTTILSAFRSSPNCQNMFTMTAMINDRWSITIIIWSMINDQWSLWSMIITCCSNRVHMMIIINDCCPFLNMFTRTIILYLIFVNLGSPTHSIGQ